MCDVIGVIETKLVGRIALVIWSKYFPRSLLPALTPNTEVYQRICRR